MYNIQKLAAYSENHLREICTIYEKVQSFFNVELSVNYTDHWGFKEFNANT